MTDSEMFGDSGYESDDAVGDARLHDLVDAGAGDDSDEIVETGYTPPEREPYNLRQETTASEQREGESLDEHLAEEEPDVGAQDFEEL